MKKISAVILSLILAFGMLMPVSAATSKSSLESRIKNKSGQDILYSYYSDYDMDGKKELFAITGSEAFMSVWFASSKQTVSLGEIGFAYTTAAKEVIRKVSKKQKLFITETGYGGSGSHSLCCYVKSGKVHKVNHRNLEGLRQQKGKKFYIHPSAFDNSKADGGVMIGHTYKRYYVRWTGSKFVEYKGTNITKKALKKYKGGSAVLKKIKKAGYKTHKIIKRKNGIININVSKAESSGWTTYNNVTLKLKNKKVTVVKSGLNAYGTDIVSKSGYGGIYKKSGY